MINLKAVKKNIQKIDSLSLVRCLIILEVAAMLFSTAAAVVVEALVFLCFISSGKLRRRVVSEFRQPMVVMALVLSIMVTIGVFYSVAPFSESMDMLKSWRKLLLVPLVASVYADVLWKNRLVYYFTGLIVFSALVSFAGYLFDFSIYNFPVGIVVDNHATQGILFSVAMFVCLVLLRFPLSSDLFPGWLLKCSAGLLALNILFVTPGRSGYLAFIVLITAFSFWGIKKKTRIIFMLLSPVVILSLLLISPVAQDRIRGGIDEIKNYEQSSELTAMGVRIVMWKNTVQLLKKFEHPLLGYGTGGFEIAYREQVANQKGWQGEPVGDPHNQYMRILVEYGLAGLILFLLFIVFFFRQRIRGRAYIMGIGVLLAWCATSMFSAHFTTFVEGRFLMIWCSALLSVSISQKHESLDL